MGSACDSIEHPMHYPKARHLPHSRKLLASGSGPRSQPHRSARQTTCRKQPIPSIDERPARCGSTSLPDWSYTNTVIGALSLHGHAPHQGGHWEAFRRPPRARPPPRVEHQDRLFLRLHPGGWAQFLLHNRFSWYVLLGKTSGTNRIHEEGGPPVNRLYGVRPARKLAARVSSHQMMFSRLPFETKRTGIARKLFNCRAIPRRILRPFGYYMIITAVK